MSISAPKSPSPETFPRPPRLSPRAVPWAVSWHGLCCDSLEGLGGTWVVFFSAQGLHRLFPLEVWPRAWRESGGVELAPLPSPWREYVEKRVAARSDKECPPQEESPPLVLPGGAFQQMVWAELRRIGWGEVRTYGEVARAVGHPRAARAVGAACGANPLPLLVPCHRVVAGDGRLGGFTWGAEWKRRLLAAEGSWPLKPKPHGSHRGSR